MKKMRVFILSLLFLVFDGSALYCQDDGGMLCGGENKIPVWILRFEILNLDTHRPVRHAHIKTLDDEGRAMSWRANSRGIGVLVATSENCLPFEGILEFSAKGYRYHRIQITRSYFKNLEEDKRILLEGHRHNWTDSNQLPTTQELINKIGNGEYRVGIKRINSGMGFDWVNYAPACFEYTVEMERVNN